MTEGRFPCKGRQCGFVGRADWELRDHISTYRLNTNDYAHRRECDECGYFECYHAKECSKSISSRLAPAIVSDTKIMAEAVTGEYQGGTACWAFNELALWDFGSAAMERMPVGKKVRVTIEVIEEGNAVS